MAEYIKREDAIMAAMNYEGSGNAQDASQDIAAEIASIHAADVRENVRGEWIGESDGEADGCPVYDMWYCSHCGYIHDDDEPPKWNFCPCCGADMRGSEKDGAQT